MGILRKIVDFFVFSSLYIAICAVVMIWQTSRLLLGVAPPGRLLGFVFFSTICSYNFHWWLTPKSVSASRRVNWTSRNKPLHFILYLVGAVGAGVYFLYLWRYIPALLFGVLLTFLYSAPKLPQSMFRQLQKIAVGKTLFLTAVWVYVTAVLPIIVAEATWHSSFFWFVASRFFLVYAICILFDYRDRDDDKAQGIRSLITLLDERGIDWLFMVTIGLFFLTSIALSVFHVPAFYILLLLIPGVLTAGLYRTAKRNFSDDLYYIVLDGLMMFSGVLMLVFRI
ncbi:MAG: UbiA family prenyltransferase [Bacteroidetes bacterium]|nr:UbiA family prenyltransferase [Bacteroidota bacterium]